MYISGINLPPGYGKDINIYSIHSIDPTWDGPELINRDTLRPGTILKILSIRRSTNFAIFNDKKVEAIVSVEPYKKTVNVPVVINLNFINSNNYMSKEN